MDFHKVESSVPSIKVPKIHKTPSCLKVVDPAADAWLGLLRKGILAAAAKARKLAQRNPTYSNLIPLVPWGMRLLKESGLLAIPTDTDAGYALVEQTAMEGICKVILESNIYE